MSEKQSRYFSISPIKKNHILLLHQNNLLKKSQQLILNNSKNSYGVDNPIILKKFEEYFNNHQVKDLRMIQEMITKSSSNNKKNSPLSGLKRDKNIQKTQYELIGINTLRKQTQKNTKIMHIHRDDKMIILNKPKKALKNSMNFTGNSLAIQKDSHKNLNNISNSNPLVNSVRKLKISTSNDISKYINQTTIEQSISPTTNFDQNSYKIHFRNSSDATKLSQNRQKISKTLQYQDKPIKLMHRQRISKNKLQQSYRDQAKFRCLSPLKKQLKVSIIQYLNPLKKVQFVQSDLLDSIAFINNVKIKNVMNGAFFNVFIQEGNNSELLKAIVRSVCGWRVVELPETANFIWTQIYRKKIVQKRPKKILRDQIIQEQKDKIRSNSKTSMNQRLNFSQLRKSQKLQDVQKFQAYIASIKSQVTFQNQLKKILPARVTLQTTVSLNKKLDQFLVTPNFLVHNHLPDHKCISDKKNLLRNLKKYYLKIDANPFQHIPQSYHLGSIQQQIIQVLQKRNQSGKQIWLIKPGEDSNRGRGIAITKGFQQTFSQLKKRLQDQTSKQNEKISPQKCQDNINQISSILQGQKKQKSVILQKYIMPLLYNQRKFDIRSYMLVTVVNNNLNAYFYQQCYIRTSSRKFDINSFNKYIHLTNDAIQCLSHDYGKYQEGNKLSQVQFKKFLSQDIRLKKQKGLQFVKNIDQDIYWNQLKREMIQRCKDIIKSVSKELFISTKTLKLFSKNMISNNLFVRGTSPTNKKPAQSQFFSTQNNSQFSDRPNPIFFQLFGLDFLIDQTYKLWLIQVNTNPAITHDCSRVLNKLIPKLLENTFSIAVMPYMRPSRLSEVNYNNQFINIFSQTFQSEKNLVAEDQIINC